MRVLCLSKMPPKLEDGLFELGSGLFCKSYVWVVCGASYSGDR